MYFLDTSALVQAYVPEAGSAIVAEALRRLDRAVAISDTVIVECLGAFARKHRTKAINSLLYRTARDAFLHDVRERFYRVPVTPEVTGAAVRLIDRFRDKGIGGIDALHLACADYLQESLPEPGVGFMCVDEKLRSTAEAHGYRVFNPEIDPLGDLVLPELPLN